METDVPPTTGNPGSAGVDIHVKPSGAVIVVDIVVVDPLHTLAGVGNSAYSGRI